MIPMVVLDRAAPARSRNIHAYEWPGDPGTAMCGRTIAQPVTSGQWGGPWRHLRTAELTRTLCWDCGRLADASMRTETIRPGLGAARIALEVTIHALDGNAILCGIARDPNARLTVPWTGLDDWHAVLAHQIRREDTCAACYRASYDADAPATLVPPRRAA